MTEEEKNALHLLEGAFEQYKACNLDAADRNEFARHILAAQNIVLAGIARRLLQPKIIRGPAK